MFAACASYIRESAAVVAVRPLWGGVRGTVFLDAGAESLSIPEQPMSPAGSDHRVTSIALEYRVIASGLAITPSVSVVIPAKNEAQNLPHVLGSIPSWVDEVVLVDGHSMDDTVAVARKLRPDVKVVAQKSRGKGDALLAGFSECQGEIIVMLDADGSTDGAEIARFVGALMTGADFAKGSRFSSSGGSDDITAARRYGNRILSGLVNSLFGTRYTDLCYGYNAFWSRHLCALALDCAGFEVETLMNIRVAQAGLRVQEVPSHERSRIHGESNLRVGRDGLRIIRVIAQEWFRSHSTGWSSRISNGRLAAVPRQSVISERNSRT